MLNIWLYLVTKLMALVNMKAVLRALVLSFFVYGQLGSTAHAHEHEEETHHTVCEYCILAFSEVDDCVDELNAPTDSDGPDFQSVYFRANTTWDIQGSVGFGFSDHIHQRSRPKIDVSGGVRAPPAK